MIDDIIRRINESPWKGLISEVGFGTAFTYNFLGTQGSSNTILYANSPYSKEFQPEVARSVSKEGVRAMLDRLQDSTPDSQKTNPLFYLVINGAHKALKDEGDSHGWIGLRTVIPRDGKSDTSDTLIHFRVAKSWKAKELDRFTAGSYVSATAFWLTKAMLLGDYSSWSDALNQFPYKDVVKINIVDDPRISLEEHLELASFNNPLIYHKGEFHRVLEYTRKYDRFMGGSFNPPHRPHLEMGKNAVFIINFENARKDNITESDMAHRVRMLSLVDVPVMILRERPFAALQAHLFQRLGKENITFITGVDTFNAICNTKYIPASDELFEPLTDEQEIEAREKILDDFLIPLYEDAGVNFEIFTRDGYEVVDNKWSKKMKFKIVESTGPSVSSTKIREGDHSEISDEISTYIKEHKLYQ